jgi:Domain of unknown function (DUF4919)
MTPRFLACYLTLALMAIALPAIAATTAPPPQEPAARYGELIARVRSGDLDVDFKELRYVYAQSPGYRPYVGPTEPLVGAMFRAYKAQDFEGAIAASKKILAINYLDIDAQIVCDLSYRLMSNSIAAEPCHEMAAKLLQSIFASGDGNSAVSAYQVIAVREEYAVINAMGLTPGEPKAVAQNGHRYDTFVVTDKDSGKTQTLWFNVDRPMGWLDRNPPRKAQ